MNGAADVAATRAEKARETLLSALSRRSEAERKLVGRSRASLSVDEAVELEFSGRAVDAARARLDEAERGLAVCRETADPATTLARRTATLEAERANRLTTATRAADGHGDAIAAVLASVEAAEREKTSGRRGDAAGVAVGLRSFETSRAVSEAAAALLRETDAMLSEVRALLEELRTQGGRGPG